MGNPKKLKKGQHGFGQLSLGKSGTKENGQRGQKNLFLRSCASNFRRPRGEEKGTQDGVTGKKTKRATLLVRAPSKGKWEAGAMWGW